LVGLVSAREIFAGVARLNVSSRGVKRVWRDISGTGFVVVEGWEELVVWGLRSRITGV
jgi:hypothetical protein